MRVPFENRLTILSLFCFIQPDEIEAIMPSSFHEEAQNVVSVQVVFRA
jgi:hypothetical protein